MELDELPAQRQAQPRSLGFLVRFADLTKFFEDRVMILRRDPDARVRHRDLSMPVCHARAHVDAAALRRELHRVGQKI